MEIFSHVKDKRLIIRVIKRLIIVTQNILVVNLVDSAEHMEQTKEGKSA